MVFYIRTHALKSIVSKFFNFRLISNKVLKEQDTTLTTGFRIKVPRNTGIEGFDKNMRTKDSEANSKHLPSWVENCRVVSQEEVDSLYRAFPLVVEDVVQMHCTKDLKIGNKELKRMMEHIVPWLPVMAVQLIAADRFYLERRQKNNQEMPNKEEHQRLVHKLSWGIEMIARKSFIADDLMDESETRNGLKCWQTFPDVGTRAINDLCALLNAGHLLLHKYFSNMDYYASLVQWTHEINFVTEIGDIELGSMKPVLKQELSQGVSSAAFEKLACAKGIFNGCIFMNLSVVTAMIMHGIRDPGLKSQAIQIGNEVMNYGIIVDECIDCFGDKRINERETTDIQEGKPSWVIWKAMELGNTDQRRQLMECYGKKDKNSIAAVMEVYEQLNVHDAVKQFAEETYLDVDKKIGMLPQEDLPCSIWFNMLNHYKDISRGIAARA